MVAATKEKIKPIVKQTTYNRIDNIPPEKRFQPGVSGNPHGRPRKEASITTCAAELLKEVGPDGKTRAQRIAATWLADLESGKTRDRAALLKEALDRTEGKVPDRVQVAGIIEYRVVYDIPGRLMDGAEEKLIEVPSQVIKLPLGESGKP